MFKERRLYEEMYRHRQSTGWVLLLLFCAALIGYSLVLHLLIPDRPRTWDFGQLDQTPAESIYSTREPAMRVPEPLQKDFPEQIQTIPGAQPLEKLEPRGYEQQPGSEP